MRSFFATCAQLKARFPSTVRLAAVVVVRPNSQVLLVRDGDAWRPPTFKPGFLRSLEEGAAQTLRREHGVRVDPSGFTCLPAVLTRDGRVTTQTEWMVVRGPQDPPLVDGLTTNWFPAHLLPEMIDRGHRGQVTNCHILLGAEEAQTDSAPKRSLQSTVAYVPAVVRRVAVVVVRDDGRILLASHEGRMRPLIAELGHRDAVDRALQVLGTEYGIHADASSLHLVEEDSHARVHATYYTACLAIRLPAGALELDYIRAAWFPADRLPSELLEVDRRRIARARQHLTASQ